MYFCMIYLLYREGRRIHINNYISFCCCFRYIWHHLRKKSRASSIFISTKTKRTNKLACNIYSTFMSLYFNMLLVSSGTTVNIIMIITVFIYNYSIIILIMTVSASCLCLYLLLLFCSYFYQSSCKSCCRLCFLRRRRHRRFLLM